MRYLLLIIISACLLEGCSSFEHRYYVVSQDMDNANYYRITLSGTTFFSSSEFQTGTAPVEVVEKFLGEGDSIYENLNDADDDNKKDPCGSTPQPKESDKPSPVSIIVDPATGRPVKKDHRILFVLSSNPNQIFTQLHSMTIAEAQEKTLLNILSIPEKKDFFRLQREYRREASAYQRILPKAQNIKDNLKSANNKEELINSLDSFSALLKGVE